MTISSKRTAVCIVDAAGKVMRAVSVDSTPDALIGLLAGENRGKRMVRVSQ